MCPRWFAILAPLLVLVGCRPITAVFKRAAPGGAAPAPVAAAPTVPTAAESGPESAELAALLGKARAAVDAGESSVAEEALDRYARARPDDPRMLAARGEMWLRRGQYERAAEDLAKAVQTKPDDPVTRRSLANALERTNRIEEASRQVAKYTELRPDDETGFYHYGELLEELGDYRAAATAYQRVARLDPGSVSRPVSLARALLMAGDSAGALKLIAPAAEKLCAQVRAPRKPGQEEGDPGTLWLTLDAYELLARAELAEAAKAPAKADKARLRRSAEKHLREITAMPGETSTAAKLRQARVWRLAGEPLTAYRLVRGIAPKALDELGAAPPGRDEMARVLLAAGKDFKRAAQEAAAALAQRGDGGNGDLVSLCGWALFKSKDYQGALAKLTQALDLARTDRQRGEINYRLFRTYEALKDAAAAQRHREAARKLGFREP
jgi:tetratricopeptide (TPR) repeat protein